MQVRLSMTLITKIIIENTSGMNKAWMIKKWTASVDNGGVFRALMTDFSKTFD